MMLLMTLTQADEMWAGVENKYKYQIKQLEDNELILKEQISEVDKEKNKWKGKCEPLEQKVITKISIFFLVLNFNTIKCLIFN